jgi:hypothetical protein
MEGIDLSTSPSTWSAAQRARDDEYTFHCLALEILTRDPRVGSNIVGNKSAMRHDFLSLCHATPRHAKKSLMLLMRPQTN